MLELGIEFAESKEDSMFEGRVKVEHELVAVSEMRELEKFNSL